MRKNFSIFRTIGKNVKANATMTNAKKAGWAALGASLYALIPTAIAGYGNTDMTGWKGWFTGFLSANFIGMAMNKPEVMMGASAAAATHILYVKGNGAVNSVLRAPIFKFGLEDKYMESLQDSRYMATLQDTYLDSLSSALNDSRTIALPSGETIVANVGPTPDEMVIPAPQLPAVTPNIAAQNLSSLNDSFEQAVANGMFVN